MINSIKSRTPILALILFVFAVGYTFAAKVVVIPLGADTAPQSFAKSVTDSGLILTGSAQAVVTISMTAPVNGQVTVHSRTLAQHDGADGSDVICGIESGGSLPFYSATSPEVQWFERGAGARNKGGLAGTRMFDISAGATNSYSLVCQEINNLGQVRHTTLIAIFTPSA